jgi:hypothetical protein
MQMDPTQEHKPSTGKAIAELKRHREQRRVAEKIAGSPVLIDRT